MQRREWHHPAGGRGHRRTVADRKGNRVPRLQWEEGLGCPLWVEAGGEAGRAPGEGAFGPSLNGTSKTAGGGGR